jgi:hypothetical protein
VSEKPGAAARAWDAAALVLVAGGAAAFLAASRGMQGLLAPHVRAATSQSVYFEKWLRYRSMSNVGVGLVCAGIAVGVIRFLRDRRAAAALAFDESHPAEVPPLAADIPPNAPPG